MLFGSSLSLGGDVGLLFIGKLEFLEAGLGLTDGLSLKVPDLKSDGWIGFFPVDKDGTEMFLAVKGPDSVWVLFNDRTTSPVHATGGDVMKGVGKFVRYT